MDVELMTPRSTILLVRTFQRWYLPPPCAPLIGIGSPSMSCGFSNGWICQPNATGHGQRTGLARRVIATALKRWEAQGMWGCPERGQRCRSLSSPVLLGKCVWSDSEHRRGNECCIVIYWTAAIYIIIVILEETKTLFAPLSLHDYGPGGI